MPLRAWGDIDVRSCCTNVAANDAHREQRTSLNKKNHKNCLYKFLFKIHRTFLVTMSTVAVSTQLSERFMNRFPAFVPELNCHSLYFVVTCI